MNIRTVLLLVVALGMAGVTAYVARGWLDAQRAALLAAMEQEPVVEKEAPVGTEVLVATRNLPTGHFVRPEDLAWQAWPEDTAIDSYVEKSEKDSADFVGSVVRTPMVAGEPITEARVVRPGERGFLAAVLDPGLRAVSVRIDATSGVAGFVFPGDRVDVILTHKIKVFGIHPTKKDTAVTRVASETVLNNVRVLAIDQSTHKEDGQPDLGKTATLEVTAKQSEMLNLTSAMGTLSLTLRSLTNLDGDTDEADMRRANRDEQRQASFDWPADAPVRARDNAEGYGFDPLTPQYLARFFRRDGRTHTWDAEVSQLVDPPISKGSSSVQLHVGRGTEGQVLEYSTGEGPFDYVLKEQEKKNKGLEDLFRDLLKPREEKAAAEL
jgi:pilus assembly protein CpaB